MFAFRLTMMVLVVGVLVAPAATTWAAPSTAQAAKARAEALNTQAKDAFRAGKFDEAAELFMQVYDLAKKPAAVFNAARAKEQADKLVEAKTLYELYLRIEKTEAGRADAKQRMSTIDARQKAQAEAKARAEAEEKARLEAEKRRASEESAKKIQEAEAKAKEAEAKARQAQLVAEKEQAERAEAEARARAEAEARGRLEAEARAKDAEARAKAAEDRARGGGLPAAKVEPQALPTATGKQQTAKVGGAAGAGGGIMTPPSAGPIPGAAAPAETAEAAGPSGVLGGVVVSVGGGASIQQTGTNAEPKPDLSFGAGAIGWLGWGSKQVPAWLAGTLEVRYESYIGFAASEPAAKPSGWSVGVGLASPRILGLMAMVSRHTVDLSNGRQPLSYTTLGVRLVMSPKTSYVALGFEGLIDSDRKDQDLRLLDEFGYGPMVRMTLEFGMNFANAGLSK